MSVENQKPHNTSPMTGIAFACTAFFLFTAMGVFNKLVMADHHAVEAVFYRNLLGTLFILAIVGVKRDVSLLKTSQPLLMSARVLIGTIGLGLTFAAVRMLPLSVASTLFFVSTLVTPILAVLLLKERLGPHRVFGIVIGFAGVLLVAQPSGVVTTLGILCALAAGVGHALTQIILRALKEESAFTVVSYFFFGGALVTLPFMPFVSHIPTAENALYLLMVGVTGCIGQVCMTRALQHTEASVVSPLNYTGLIWALMFDIALWGIVPDAFVLTGAALIIGANLYILHRERNPRLTACPAQVETKPQ